MRFPQPLRVLLLVIGAISLSETFVMLFLSVTKLVPTHSSTIALLDSVLLTTLLTPLLYLLLYRPLRNYHARWEASVAALQRSERRFRDIADVALDWIWEVDREGKYTYTSPAVRKVLGYEQEEMLEKHFFDLFHPEDREELKAAAFHAFAARQSFRSFENRNLHKDGHVVWLSTSGLPILDEEGELLGYRGADTDITQLKQTELQLKEAALSDELTGLLNRRGFYALAELHFKIAERNKWSVALLYADLDDFKRINDEFGHSEGDRVLREVADALRRTFRQSDVIGRLGGDEFAVLLTAPAEASVEEVAVRHLLETLKQDDERGQGQRALSLSIGFAARPHDEDRSLDDLLAEADRSMYERKRARQGHGPGGSPARSGLLAGNH